MLSEVSTGTTSPAAIVDQFAGGVIPSTCAAATASWSVRIAPTFVYTSSLTSGFSSSGPVTPSMWYFPSLPSVARDAQNAAAPDSTGQPCWASHVLSPVTR